MASGRPRSFDAEKALDRALKVFWRKGYEGASLEDLTKAMRISRPSLYAAFGNKEALFKKVMDRYATGPALHTCLALNEPTARGVVEAMLHGSIDLLTDPRHPPGCLAVHGALACGDEAAPVRKELMVRRNGAMCALHQRLQRAIDEGDLPSDADAEAMARYVTMVGQGMSVQASTGAGRAELEAMVEMVMRGWPWSGAKR